MVVWGRLELMSETPVLELAPYQSLDIPRSYELSSKTHVIGRNEHKQFATLVLPFAVVSGQHCVLSLDSESGRALLTDKSSNGTSVNGAAVGKGASRPLEDEDVVTVFRKVDATKAAVVIEYRYRSLKARGTGKVAAALEKQNAELGRDGAPVTISM